MKNIKSKIILSIVLIISILIIASTSMGVIEVNNKKYYTKSDISFYSGQIHVRGGGGLDGDYYCTNHKRTLTGGMGNDASFEKRYTIEKTTVPAAGVIDSQEDVEIRKESFTNAMIEELTDVASSYLGSNNRTATFTKGTTNKGARDPLEAAIYAFSSEPSFNVSVQSTKEAIWNYEYMKGHSAPAEGNYPTLWNAAKAWVTWAGYPAVNKNSESLYTGNNGTFKTKTPPTITANSDNAKINFIYDDACYVVGPFTIEYEAGPKYGDIRFTKNFKVDIIKTTDSGTTAAISTSNVVDVNGKQLSEIPNGDAFYIKIPYAGNEDLKEITLNASLDYISQIHGYSTTYVSSVQFWKYELRDTDMTYTTTIRHSTACPLHPAASEAERYEETISGEWTYKNCCNWTAGKDGLFQYKAEAKGYLRLMMIKEKDDIIQNMRTIGGEVKWANTTAKVSVKIEQEMKIAGNVWEDTKTGKDSTFNGSLDTADVMLEGIEVRLYESDGTLARVGNTNPTLTDKNGHYEFTEVNPTKKYFVRFTYDGMMYTNTYRTETNKLTYNTDAWNAVSKGSEIVSDRVALNTKFVTIGSYPKGYKPTTAIFTDMTYLVDGYNEVYSINDADVLAYKAKVTEQLKNYLKTNNRLLNENYIKTIYQPILDSITDSNEKVKAAKILQFIWDCRIHSYAGYESVRDGKTSKTDGLYPYYNKIIISDNEGNLVTSNTEKNINGYWVIYNGQLNINQGIIRRNQTDLEITERPSKVVVSINGKDETYIHSDFQTQEKRVNILSSDIKSYTQNVAGEDFNYKVSSANLSSDLTNTAEYPEGYAPIQLYATYRIKVENTSMQPTSVKEIVTYFDTNYFSYSDTYTTTQGNTIVGLEGKFITNDEEKNLADYDADCFGMKANTTSIYGEASETGKAFGADMYIAFEEDIVLNNNEGLALYVTYRLGENSTKDAKYNCTYNESNRGNSAQVILQDKLPSEGAQLSLGTQTEINSFSTYYAKSSDIPSTQSKYANYYTYTSPIDSNAKYRAAGVLDSDSIPGNLNEEEIQKAHQNATRSENEQVAIEDDWDSAAKLIFIEDVDSVREIHGNVWEVTRKENGVEILTEKHWATEVDDYPIYGDSAYGKAVGEGDITVELIEFKDTDGDGQVEEYVRATTTTANDGSYVIDRFIPGEYAVRFIYGDKAHYKAIEQPDGTITYETVQHSDEELTINGNNVKRPYNGIFYQSTKANPNTNQAQFWYAGDDADNIRYSDAYDETNIRLRLNGSQTEYTYADIIDVLRQPSNYLGYAYTSMLDIYPEKATTITTVSNPGYTISNIDFGLTPRSLADLDISKEVVHLKLILANGKVQFDVDTSTIREQGVPAVTQAAQGDNINIQMSSELVDGATLEITYAITVENNTTTDKIIHYKDTNNNVIAIGLYNENADKLVAFEDEIRKYKDNFSNFERLSDGDAATFDPWVSKIAAGTTEKVQIDESKKEILMSETKPLVIADFIPNNMSFIKNNYAGQGVNDVWDLYTGTKDDLAKTYYQQRISSNPPQVTNMSEQTSEVYESNTIVLANDRNPLITTNLKPGDSVTAEIVLSKVISESNDSMDNKTYQNKVRILKIYSSDSRLQDMPADISEKVIISDPTGIGNKYMVIAIALIALAVIGLGTVLIKKFVISNK